MINSQKITQCLSSLVGFGFEGISEVLKVSASGITVNMMHPLISKENISNSILLGKDIDVYLSEKYKQACVQLANEVYVYKNLNGHSKTLLADAQLYHGVAKPTNVIEKKGRFVGFQINVKHRDVAVNIQKTGFQLEGNEETFKLYLYHSSQYEPIKTWDITHSKAFSFQWSSISEAVLTKLRAETDSGVYYLGYYESDLKDRAINKEVSLTKAPCTCDAVNHSAWKKWNPHFEIQSFSVDAAHLNTDRKLWDIEFNRVSADMNFGINMMVSAQCDTTDVFCTNKNVLANALALKIAVALIEDMANSLRDNQQQIRLAQLAHYALNNKENGTDGLYSQMQREIQKLSFNFSDISPKCLPCDAIGNDVSFSSVY